MFDVQRGYLTTVQDRGFRLPDRYLEFDAAGRARSARRWRRTGARRCRATTTCSRRTSSTTASRLWIIDFEYAGNNDPCFELGNIWSESTPADSTSSTSW